MHGCILCARGLSGSYEAVHGEEASPTHASYKPERASQVVLVVKNLPANAGDIRDEGSIPGSGRSPGGGYGNPLQYPCLENPTDREAWRATVHGVTLSRTELKRLSTHTLADGPWHT